MMDSIKQDLKAVVEEEEDQYEKDMKLQVGILDAYFFLAKTF